MNAIGTTSPKQKPALSSTLGIERKPLTTNTPKLADSFVSAKDNSFLNSLQEGVDNDSIRKVTFRVTKE